MMPGTVSVPDKSDKCALCCTENDGIERFFVLLSLLFYATARTRQIDGQSGAPLRLSLIPLTFLLALFSKETGAPLIVYLFMIEWLVFRFAAKSSTTSRRVRYTYLVMAIVIAPVALFMLYHFSFGYGHRELNLTIKKAWRDILNCYWRYCETERYQLKQPTLLSLQASV
jgi:hypothetical protein